MSARLSGVEFGMLSIARDLSDLDMVGITEAPVEQIPLDRMLRAVREAGRLAN